MRVLKKTCNILQKNYSNIFKLIYGKVEVVLNPDNNKDISIIKFILKR